MERLLRMKHKEEFYHKEFQRIFGVSLKSYYDYFTGFDIVKFDEECIKTPDNKSMREVVFESYGEEGEELINTLIDTLISK